MLVLDEFEDDAPWSPENGGRSDVRPIRIHGAMVTPLVKHGDPRGDLCELMTLRGGDIDPIVHVYQVYAEPGSIRAWVYHKRQWDRLAFTQGHFRVVLYDIRENSPTFGNLEVLDIGIDAPTRLHIPPFVVHGVKNCGDQGASFVNMPTAIYDPADPDKARLPMDHPGVPFSFDD